MNRILDIIPPQVLQALLQAVPETESVYLVGGAVRDALLGIPAHDLDFCLAENVSQAARRTAELLGAVFFTLDDARGNYRLMYTSLEGTRSTIDFARLREPSIEGDLLARDFSIDAIATDLKYGQVFDPSGGATDLRNRTLRMCSAHAFSDDPVRILRGVRLAARFQLRIHPQTRKAMADQFPEISQAAPERERDEIFRMLECARPSTAFRVLEILGGLPVLFPELATLKKFPQTRPHYQDVWNHTLTVMDHLAGLVALLAGPVLPDGQDNLMTAAVSGRLGRYRPQLREHFSRQPIPGRSLTSLLLLAALYHDAGKPGTAAPGKDGRIHNYDHEKISSTMVTERARALQLSRVECERLATITRHHMRIHSLVAAGKLPSRRAMYRFFRDTGDAGIDVCLHTLADTAGTYGPSLPQDTWFAYLDVCQQLMEAWWIKREEQVDPPALLDGNDLQEIFHLAAGPQLGDLLAALRENQACGAVQNRQEAVAFIEKMLKTN